VTPNLIFTYAGDALWVVALTIMFSASRQAWRQTTDRPQLKFLGGQMRRDVTIWLLPVATFSASIWLAIQARQAQDDAVLLDFAVRAAVAPLLTLLHLRWLGQALRS
jgi:hypothetical protein